MQELRAIAELFRQQNEPWIENAMGGHPKLLEIFSRGWHFADFAIQVHSGDEISDSDLGWHSDAPNSLLHLAFAVRGNRNLHSIQTHSGQEEHIIHPQQPGDIYVSSPFAFLHAVEYPACAWADRIIAIQCRILMTPEDQAMLTDLAVVTETVTSALAPSEISLPSLSDVNRMVLELSDPDPPSPALAHARGPPYVQYQAQMQLQTGGHFHMSNCWKPQQHLHIEHGHIQSGSIVQGWWSACWKLETCHENFVRLVNKWKPDHCLHIEHGDLQCTPVQPGWWSAMWMIEPVDPASIHRAGLELHCVRIRNRWTSQCLHIEHGQICVGESQPGWLSAMWMFCSSG